MSTQLREIIQYCIKKQISFAIPCKKIPSSTYVSRNHSQRLVDKHRDNMTLMKRLQRMKLSACLAKKEETKQSNVFNFSFYCSSLGTREPAISAAEKRVFPFVAKMHAHPIVQTDQETRFSLENTLNFGDSKKLKASSSSISQ